MENFLNISVVSNSSNLPNKNLLSRFQSLYSRLYDCQEQASGKNESSYLKLIFKSPENISSRFQKIIKLFDSFLINSKAHPSQSSSFHPETLQQENSNDPSIINSSMKFAVIKYQTDLKSYFKDYYNYLNHFFPLINIGAYIEEVGDGFLLFFEKEIDLTLFLFDFHSMDSLKKLLEDKHVSLPVETQQKISIFIQKK
ncbi:hypothetical protein [Candidatus Lokiarchaeum ossiferum]|uniref:hypothetical protein n=1 Tax=Candidatus Lokiarchaeum ossiferum TaxID=2951803 RepID=UPI00352F7962